MIKKQVSITFKIAVCLSVLITFLILIIGAVAVLQLKTVVQEEAYDKGRFLTGLMMPRLAGVLQAGNVAGLTPLIAELKAQGGVQSAIVTDSKGKVLAGSARQLTDNDIWDVAGTGDRAFISEIIKVEGIPKFVFTRQVIGPSGNLLGWLGVVTDAGQMQHKIKDLIIYLGTTTVAAVIAGIFLAMVISRRIFSRPIKDLVAATEDIAVGNVTTKVDLHQRDELGDLAMSFNIMTGYLANLFRSIISYTGELVKSCQLVTMRIKSTVSASGRLVESMDKHAAKAREHIDLLQGCADLACELVDRVEQSGQALKQKAEAITAAVEDSGEPGALMTRAAGDVADIGRSLNKLQKAVESCKDALLEVEQMSGLFTDYLDYSRTFSFNIAVEVARLGGADMTDELKKMQGLADEGMAKTRDMLHKMQFVGETVTSIEDAVARNIKLAAQGGQSIEKAGVHWERIDHRLTGEKETAKQLVDALVENNKRGEQLLEALEHLMTELDKSLQSFIGTGVTGKKQTEQLGELEATLRKILRVSNTLNNLCLQFKVDAAVKQGSVVPEA